MQLVVLGLVVLAVLALGLPALTRANPARLARLLRWAGGAVLSVFALLLLLRGQIHVAFLLLGIGLPLIFARGGRLFGGKPKLAGQTSSIQTATLRVVLDHDSGSMEGEVLAGRFAGRPLASLAVDDLLTLLAVCQANDAKSLPLMEAYLDFRSPDWRDTAAGGAGAAGTPAATLGRMTESEARQILGVGADANDEDIRAAWRELMKRNHPDQGGSSYLAAKINEAKDLLLATGGPKAS